MWKGLLSARDLLEEGKRVEDGKTINLWEDRWIWNTKDGKVRTIKLDNCPVVTVDQLKSNGVWNTNLLNQLFNKEDVMNIQKIPIYSSENRDKLVWTHSANGVYSVKSGYAKAKDVE
ncbi:hypothetical protein ACH5RR_000279 [Cinchona calisaya]|uniref:Uncharacterized protein n=1 Tax=Cinchona calisaya TaxID=153742 RepID=A0ABD3B0V8_9GENT